MSNCPYCSTPGAYQGFNSVECPNSKCEAFCPSMVVTPASVAEVGKCTACGFEYGFVPSNLIKDDTIFESSCVDPRCALYSFEATRRWVLYVSTEYARYSCGMSQTFPSRALTPGDSLLWPEPFTAIVPSRPTGHACVRVSASGFRCYWEVDFNTFTCTYFS